MRRDSFTEREGVVHPVTEQEIDVVPVDVRRGLVTVMHNVISMHTRLGSARYGPMDVNKIVYASVFQRSTVERMYRFNEFILRAPHNIPRELEDILGNCLWNVFFDIAEAVAGAITVLGTDAYLDFGDNFNQLLAENGVQWTLDGGEVKRRRDEPIAATIEKTLGVLDGEGFEQSKIQFLKAARALDERPEQ